MAHHLHFLAVQDDVHERGHAAGWGRRGTAAWPHPSACIVQARIPAGASQLPCNGHVRLPTLAHRCSAAHPTVVPVPRMLAAVMGFLRERPQGNDARSAPQLPLLAAGHGPPLQAAALAACKQSSVREPLRPPRPPHRLHRQVEVLVAAGGQHRLRARQCRAAAPSAGSRATGTLPSRPLAAAVCCPMPPSNCTDQREEVACALPRLVEPVVPAPMAVHMGAAVGWLADPQVPGIVPSVIAQPAGNWGGCYCVVGSSERRAGGACRAAAGPGRTTHKAGKQALTTGPR